MAEPETHRIGSTDLTCVPFGLGTWQWGDRAFWSYGSSHQHADVVAAFDQTIAAGVTLFDTAEMYGWGTSERILGECLRRASTKLVVATKYFPFPWRLTAGQVRHAVDGSLARLGVACIDLYQIHQPISLISDERLLGVLADLVHEGKLRAIGVSNYSVARMRRAHAILAKRGIPLAVNQVHYSLLHRKPETNGVYGACRELRVGLIAYSPLEQGLLTGKYRPGAAAPAGVRRFMPAFRPRALARIAPVTAELERIGAAHGGKTPAQVALNWLLYRGTIPIPGAKNAAQAAANVGALGWSITDAEAEDLSRLTAH